MRRSGGLIMLIVLAGLGGCAHPAPSETGAGTAPQRGGPVAQRRGVVPCTLTDLGVATVSHCGTEGMSLGVAAD